MLAAIDAAGPGAAVVITQQGRTLYASARGMASVELQVPLTVNSIFRIGSITKSFTATAILALSEQKRLDLDAPLARWLPDLPRASDITLRQLLSHTAGVSDAWEAPLTEVLDTQKRLALIGSKPLDFAPGTDWQYSNSGYMLLGIVLEKVTGRPWYAAVDDLVVKPLGLSHTGFHKDADVVPGLVAGYSRSDTGATTRPILYSIEGPGAAGALTATAGDIAGFVHGLGHGDVLHKETIARMFAPTRIGEATVPYGWGVMTGTVRGEAVVEHNGMIDGYSAHYVYVPARDIVVVVLENDDAPQWQARSLTHRLAALALGKPYTPFVEEVWSSSRVAALVGIYTFGEGSHHEITLENGLVYISRDGGKKRLLRTAAHDMLYYDGDGIDGFTVIRGADGKVTALDFRADGESSVRRESKTAPAVR